MRKIGIFGGTFDPIHNAHLAVAETAYKQLGLDFVIMMTGGNPPHKRDMRITDAKLRHIMLKIAIKDIDGLIASDWEINRREYSYSVNTLKFFKNLYPDDRLYFIIGGDSLENLKNWYQPEQICRLCTLAVYGRGRELDIEAVKSCFGADIVMINGDFMAVSSTSLRENSALLAENLPPRVYEFIERYGLYKPARDDMRILEQMLSPERLAHSVGVAELAAKLAGRWGYECDIAYRAGLLHDNAKDIGYADALAMCGELEAQLDAAERFMPPLIHAKLGAELAKCLFSLSEGDITSAIRWHTLGKSDMSLLEKIIFVADMCEEGRKFDAADDIRAAAFENLDKAALMCINSTIEFNLKKNNRLHPGVYEVRDYFLKNL